MTGSMSWEKLLTAERLGGGGGSAPSPARNEFQRDYDRIVFSSAFRRLHDKTQVFPMPENDHVHSRLTHSLEVSCVGRSLGVLVGAEIVNRHGLGESYSARDFGDIVAAACLAHDIGNPPFGHSGEDAIRNWFRDGNRRPAADYSDAEREDFVRFEGNAQGLRILTRLQMAKGRGGMRLTHATLGAFSKYPREALLREDPGGRRSGKKHGFFQSEKGLFAEAADSLGLLRLSGKDSRWCRHPLAFLVEAADDICYQILDLEDGFRLGKVAFDDAYDLLTAIAPPGEDPRPSDGEERKSTIGYLRARTIDILVREVAEEFLKNEREILSGGFDRSLVTVVPSKEKIDAVTDLVVRRCYRADEVLEIEIAGYEVIGALLDRFVPAALRPGRPEHEKIRVLMPALFREEGSDYEKTLPVTDFVSGMTDSFAVSIFRRFMGIALPR
ncbi:MAG: deoxyguanosinetriphosphate triphosphohydrolase [Candidatus Eisenbacteria bacterium]